MKDRICAVRELFAWSIVLLSLGWIEGASLYQGAEGAVPLDLAGTVSDKSGQPVSNATVLIYTAGPRVGLGTI